MPLSPVGFWRPSAATVSPHTNNVNNSDDITTVYSCLQYSSDGYERTNSNPNNLEYNNTAARGLWLDSGSSSDVWLERTINSGSLYVDAGAGRLNLGTSRNFAVMDANPTATQASCNLTMDFWNASSGGTKIGTATFSLIASYFDSCPTCCFTPETPVLMASGMWMPIGSIRKGDLVVVLDKETRTLKSVEVTGVIVRLNRPMFRLHFASGRVVQASDDHPFEVKGKGPASLNHYNTEYKDLGLPAQLQVGDMVTCLDFDGHDKLVKIEPMDYPGAVFTLENSLFFAKGLLVY